jgi:hypothetical protein
MAKNILKRTNRKVAVKVSGTGVTETITLATDCKNTGETLLENLSVEITSVRWSGAPDATATITRDGDTILILQANAAGNFDMADSEYVESLNSGDDIVVTTSGNMQVYLLLRKSAGYFIDDPQQYSTLP